MATAVVEPVVSGFRRTLATASLYLARVSRLAVVMMAVLMAVFLGLWSGTPLSVFLNRGGWVADVVLKGTFFIGTIKELVGLLPRVGKYIWTGLGDGLYGVSSFLFLTFLTLTVASVHSPDTIADLRTVIFLKAGLESPAVGRTFSVPFFGRVSCGYGGDFGDGADPKDSSEFIKQLTTGLSGCSTRERPVTVEVRGYASSKDFPAACGAQSENLNKGLAQNRAENVMREMKRAEGHIDNLEQPMAIIPLAEPGTGGLNDKDSSGQTDPRKTAMTKRADIVITDAGTCTVAMR